MKSSVNIRSASIDDLKQISIIEDECFSAPWTLKALTDFFSLEYSHILVADYNGEIAGYVTYSIILDELQIANVAVSQRFRRMHIGSFIIDKLIIEGTKRNCSIAYLEVRKSNIPAIALYKNCGFCIVGERKNFYASPTENALLMNYIFKS